MKQELTRASTVLGLCAAVVALFVNLSAAFADSEPNLGRFVVILILCGALIALARQYQRLSIDEQIKTTAEHTVRLERAIEAERAKES